MKNMKITVHIRQISELNNIIELLDKIKKDHHYPIEVEIVVGE